MPMRLVRVLVDPDPIPKHSFNRECEYLKAGMCFYCCDMCNYDRHTCYLCGAYVDHNDRDLDGEPHGCYEEEAQDEFFDLLRKRGVILD